VNDQTLVAVCCYQGDAHQVVNALPVYQQHGCKVVILSPEDSPVVIPGVECQHAGKRAYIGADSLHRQLRYFEKLLLFPHTYMLLHDSDSLCLSAKIPERLYYESEKTVWSNEVQEPRPHASPYPKIAMQPPYFLTRDSIWRMLNIAGRLNVHPITPYVDWFMLALTCEAGLKHMPFTHFEHPSYCDKPFEGTDPWQQLDYRIRYMGTNFVHPIKTPEQVRLCVEARKFYESPKS